MRWLQLTLLPALMLSSACNMVISETPMFDESDRASLTVKDGIWLAELDECDFDAGEPVAKWPECSLWVVVRKSGRELLLSDGKGQTQSLHALFADGTPLIIQTKWEDDAKEPKTSTYGFYGIEWRHPAPDGFIEASIWSVECGVQDPPGSRIGLIRGSAPSAGRPQGRDSIGCYGEPNR